MTSMGNEFVNQELEGAAKRRLTHIAGSEDSLKPLYLQPDRALFLAENLHIILKVYRAGRALQREYDIAQKASAIGVPIPKMLGFEAGPPAVLAMQQVIGRPLSSRTPFAAKEAGRYLHRGQLCCCMVTCRQRTSLLILKLNTFLLFLTLLTLNREIRCWILLSSPYGTMD